MVGKNRVARDEIATIEFVCRRRKTRTTLKANYIVRLRRLDNFANPTDGTMVNHDVEFGDQIRFTPKIGCRSEISSPG